MVYLQPFRRKFSVEVSLHPKIAKKSLKPLLENSRSFKVIDVDKSKNLSPVFVMISNVCVPIGNRFNTRRANKVKITFFTGGTFFDTFVREESPHPEARNFVSTN